MTPTGSARFIAGAVCPQCRAMDRLVVETVASGDQRRCVNCGYTDQRAGGAGSEPVTRLTRRGQSGEPASPVRIIGPAPRSQPDETNPGSEQ